MEACSNRRGRAGTVYVEFLIVFWPMMVLWLGLGQIGLMYGANIVVNHAAARAVRAAIVILPDDKEGWEDRYAGVAPLKIGSGGSGLGAYKSAPSGGRLEAIRRAARITLAPISPGLGTDAGGGVVDFLVGYLWTDFAVAVTFPDDGDGYRSSFGATGPVTARVTYLYRCPVPLANALICHNYWGSDSFISEETRQKLEEAGELAGVEGTIDPGISPAAQKELDTVGGDVLGALGIGVDIAANGFEGGSGWQFLALRAERTLPMQGRNK